MKYLFLLLSSGIILTLTPSKSIFTKYDFGKKKPAQIVLPKELKEISGIVFSDKEEMFGHNDEEGIIFQINLKSGDIIKKFYLGQSPFLVKEDFEDIALASGKFYLLTSSGNIYEFEEAGNNGKTDYKVYETGITRDIEVEGLCYDKRSNSLLIAAKTAIHKEKNYRNVYSFSLKNKMLNSNPKFRISLDELKNKFGIKDLYPSAIQYNQASGTYYVLSAKDRPVIAEVATTGEILHAAYLDDKSNLQPEGLAFAKNGTVYISNEGAGKKGTINIYPIN